MWDAHPSESEGYVRCTPFWKWRICEMHTLLKVKDMWDAHPSESEGYVRCTPFWKWRIREMHTLLKVKDTWDAHPSESEGYVRCTPFWRWRICEIHTLLKVKDMWDAHPSEGEGYVRCTPFWRWAIVHSTARSPDDYRRWSHFTSSNQISNTHVQHQADSAGYFPLLESLKLKGGHISVHSCKLQHTILQTLFDWGEYLSVGWILLLVVFQNSVICEILNLVD